MARRPVPVLVEDKDGNSVAKYDNPDEAAKAHGVSRNVIYTWLNGRVQPKDGNIWKWESQPKIIGPRKGPPIP
jgi:hypothetical protein